MKIIPPKKILHVIPSMNPELGGVCQALKTIIICLSNKGINNEVVSLDPVNAPYNDDVAFPIHSLGPAKGPWQYSPRLIPWLKANLMRFDVVIVHGIWLFHGYAVRKAARHLKHKNKLLHTRFFIFPHGMLDPYFQLAKGRKLKAVRNYLYWKFVERKIVNEADGIFFTAERERELAHESFTPYKPKRENVVGMSIDRPPVYNSMMRKSFSDKCPQLGESSYILFLSRLHEKKGVDILITAYTQILSATNKRVDLPKLVIAGPGLDTDYGQILQKSANSYQDCIFFPGMLTGDAKWGAFYGCEAFILPTHQENFGIAIVEALACGKPVLISDQTNIYHEIQSNGGGLVAMDTVAGIKELLENWLNVQANERRDFEVRALDTYERFFSMEVAKKKLIFSIN